MKALTAALYRLRSVCPVAALALSLTGCATLFPTDPRQEARGRWDKIRGRIKLQLAQDQFDAGRIQDAESQLKEALGLDPTSPAAHILTAKLHLEKGELIAAKEALDAAVSSGGSSAEIDYLFGVIAQRYGDHEAALSYYHTASVREPQSAAYVVAETETMVSVGRLTEALELIRSRRNDFERNATLRSLTGDIHTMLGQYEEAADAYREAALLAPDDPQAQLQLGTSLARAGRYQETIAVLAPTLKQTSDAPWSARLALGRAYLARGEAPAARDVFRGATRTFAAEADPWTWLARASLSCNDLMSARQAAEKSVALAPRSASNWLLLGFVCRRQQDYTQAQNALKTAVELDPADPLAHCLAGQVLESTNRRTDAVSHYKRAVDLDPSFEWARDLLAAADTQSPRD